MLTFTDIETLPVDNRLLRCLVHIGRGGGLLNLGEEIDNPAESLVGDDYGFSSANYSSGGYDSAKSMGSAHEAKTEAIEIPATPTKLVSSFLDIFINK